MPNADIDLTGGSSIAQRLLANGFDTDALRPHAGIHTNGLLRKDEWKQIADDIMEIHKREFQAVADLRNAGLTRDLGDLGVMLTQWEEITDEFTGAEVNFSGVTQAEEDAPEFGLKSRPVPITSKNFRINLRKLLASRRRGADLETTSARMAAREVDRTLEDMLIDGHDFTLSGDTIYGYRDHPDRNQVSLNSSNPWDDRANTTPEDIKRDVQAMRDAIRQDNIPVDSDLVLYIDSGWEERLSDEYTVGGELTGRTIREELENAIDGLDAIRPLIRMQGDEEAVMVTMRDDTVELHIAEEPQPVQGQEVFGFQQTFKVFAGMVPVVKSDGDNQIGVAHLS